MWTKSCTWCKVILVVAIALIMVAIAGLTVSSGGAAAGAVVAAGKAVGIAIGAAASVAIAKLIIVVVGAGLGALLGDILCCKLFGIEACCIKESVEFWKELARLLELSGGEPLSTEDCEAMRKLIDRLQAEKKINADTAKTLRDELKQHCPE